MATHGGPMANARLAAVLLVLLLSAPAARPQPFPPADPPRPPPVSGASLHFEYEQVLSLAGTPDEPRAGDVLADSIMDDYRTIDAPPDPARPGPMWEGRRLLEAGTGRVIAVRVGGDGPLNPLAALDEATLGGLGAVYLEATSPSILACVARLDLRRVCVVVVPNPDAPEPGRLPPLPVRLERLVLAPGRGLLEFTDFTALAELRALKLLVLRAGSPPPELLAGMKDLRVLVTGGGLRGWPGGLEALTALRHLDLARNASLRDIGFARALRSLRVLRIAATGVTDLSPLDAHPQLRRLDVRGTDVRFLPCGALPALAEVRAFLTRISREEAERFRRENPSCRLVIRPADELRTELAGADELRIERAPWPTVVRDPQAIRELLAAVDVEDMGRSPATHACGGDYSLWFHAGETLLGHLTSAHGNLLDWSGWPQPGELTPSSARAVARWLAARGCPRALEQLDDPEAGGNRGK